MTIIPALIEAFLMECHVMSIATCDGREPWAASVFYAYDPDTRTLLFVGSPSTRHAVEIMNRPRVAGTIAGQPRAVQEIQGVQFSGICALIADELGERAAFEQFYQRFPEAKARPAKIWSVELDYLKFISNIEQFGKKITWSRHER